MKFKIFIIFISLLIQSNQSLAKEFKSESFSLKNGMQVVVINNSKVPAISHMLWYKVGAIDEPVGKSGIAHFLEHLMFKSTKNYPSGEFSSQVAKSGGNENAFTSWDFTGYYQNIAKNKLEMVMRFESDRMNNIIFDEKEIQSERKVVLEERNSRIENSPIALLLEQMRSSLYMNHPYRLPIIGWSHEIKNINLKDLKDFYKKYYTPRNAILVISGDVTADEVKVLAEKYYGVIDSGEKYIRDDIKEPVHHARRKISLYDEKVNADRFIRYYLAPSFDKNDVVKSFALVLLSNIIGEGQTSTLYQDLVVDKKLSTSISTNYNDLSISNSIFSIAATPAQNTSLKELEKNIDENIETILKKGVSDEDLARAKKSLMAQSIYSQEDLKSLAYIYGYSLVTGAGVDYVENWDKYLTSVKSSDIIEVAKEIFNPQYSVTGYLQKDE